MESLEKLLLTFSHIILQNIGELNIHSTDLADDIFKPKTIKLHI